MKPISVGSLEAAKMLGISTSTLNRLTSRGELQPWRIFGDKGYRYFAVADLEDFVRRRIDNANQAALSAKSEHILPALEGQNGDQCEGIGVSQSGRLCNGGTSKDGRENTSQDSGVSARQKEKRSRQRL